MSQYDTILSPGVLSFEISVDDSVPGYQHQFSLQYIVMGVETPITEATFAFGTVTNICY